ncbi:MAG: DUF177 domain-containing protein [Verrucomicrobiae bacterium]|nr:DUF177 domain-containing protein [Verrucomicrobiae bacterium]
MKISIHLVSEEGLHIDGEDPGSILDVQDHEWTFAKPVNHSLDASMLPDALLVTGRVWTDGTVRCSRCLQPFSQRLEVTDFAFHHPITSEDIVDLTPEIRESILLEIPQKPLCRADCKGLCPVCGIDRNKQSCKCARETKSLRWAGLDDLKL